MSSDNKNCKKTEISKGCKIFGKSPCIKEQRLASLVDAIKMKYGGCRNQNLIDLCHEMDIDKLEMLHSELKSLLEGVDMVVADRKDEMDKHIASMW